LVLDQFKECPRCYTIPVEQREQCIEHLRLTRMVALPTRWRLLPHDTINLQRQPCELVPVFGLRFSGDIGSALASRKDLWEVPKDHGSLSVAVKHRRNVLLRLFRHQPLNQCFGFPKEILVSCGIRTALLDQITQEFRHFGVKPRVGELVTDDGLANVVDDALRDGVSRQLALLVQLAGDGVVDAGFDDQFRE
jgi:hypothetical protein